MPKYSSKSPGSKASLAILTIIVIWGFLILPSSFSPAWSYLDDPTNVFVGKSLASDFHFPAPDGTTGRYVPFYDIYHGILYRLFGNALPAYYLVQSLFFLISLVLIYWVVYVTTRRVSAGFCAAFVAMTASPVAENVYTIGKSEPNILFYLICIIGLFIVQRERAESVGTFARFVAWLCIVALMCVAVLTKETAAVISVFAFSGAVITYLSGKNENLIGSGKTRDYLILLACSVFSIVLSRGLFYATRPAESLSVYTSYPIKSEVVLNNLKFYTSQQPDVLFLGIVVALLLGVLYRQRGQHNAKSLVLASTLFLTSSAYIVGLLIWRWALGYYLLIPSSFFSIALAISLWSVRGTSISGKIAYVAVLFLVLLTRLYSIPYSYYVARAQRAQDRIYTEAVERYMQIAKPGEWLLVEEWPFFVEPVVQSNVLVHEIFGKRQLQVEGVQDILSNMIIPEDVLRLNNFSRILDGTSRSPKKNDYILTFTGDRQSSWMLRGVSPFLNESGSIYRKRGLKLEDVASDTAAWKGISYDLPSLWGLPSFGIPRIRTFSAGYSLYRIKDPVPFVTVKGETWPDGWMGRHLLVQATGGPVAVVFSSKWRPPSAPDAELIVSGLERPYSFSGPGGGQPVTLCVPRGHTVSIEASRVFVPKLLHVNDDGRALSYQFKLIPVRSCSP